MVKFEDVKDLSTEEYFNGNDFSIDIFNKKYSLNGETYVQTLKRVCDYIASAESTEELRMYWSERWFNEIFNDWWHPAGSIMQGANSGKKISMANCTTISLGVNDENNEWDNLESLYKNTAYTVAKTAAYRQGLGIDFSRIRPQGLNVLNSSKESQGVIHWMKFIDSIGNFIGQSGRTPAMLMSLNISHPDIKNFITVKSDYTKIQNANISVQITNDFMEAVKNDSNWKLIFEIPQVNVGDKVYVDVHSCDMDCLKDESGKYYKVATKNRPYEKIEQEVNAKELLELLAKNMLQNAEPGVQFIDMAKYWSNSDYLYEENSIYDPRIISTNACSEQYLSRESLCVLASINCGKFSKDDYVEELSIISPSVNRFLDNVNEMEVRDNTYATPHQRVAIQALRRTGAGLTNLSGWLFKNNAAYGSLEGNELLEKFNERYNYFLYKSSIELGAEKGSFGMFSEEKFTKSPFIQNLMKKGLEFKTMRNVTCSSVAPAGTLSTMFRDFVMSYGVEPAFGLYFWKRTRISGQYEYYFCVPNVVREYFKESGYEIPMSVDCLKDTWDGSLGAPIAKFIDEAREKLAIKFKTATEVPVQDKLDLMSRLMKDVDSSISVTYTLPEGSTWKDTYDLIVGAYEKGVKSIAAFPDKKMYGIISFIPFKELAVKLTKENVAIYDGNLNEEEKKTLGVVKSGSQKSFSSDAPKRSKTLDQDVYVVTSKGKKYIISVGKQDGKLYEIFGGLIPENLSFKFTHKHGKMTKVSQGHYTLEIGDDIVVNNFGEIFTAEEQMLFRMISTSLRHGIPVKFIVQQMSKSAEDMSSLTSVVGRVLKKYILDGESANGMKCPACGSKDLTYGEGCVSCSCGWSKCN
jgi:ribonucleoside-diphosphate reductase alpha chain